MTWDAVELDRELRRRSRRQGFDWFKWLALIALAAFSLYMFLWEFSNEYSDLYKHAVIASEFNFADLHSITSRLAYPLWHLCVSALFQLGVPLNWSAALMCTLSKALAYLLVRRWVVVMLEGQISDTLATLCALLLMVVTPIRIAGVNDSVYRVIGSPTVWHNPTQLAVMVTAMLCVPYLMHCWYAFERELPKNGARTALPWGKVLLLAALLMLSLATKPTFMQALIPAAAAFFLWQWIRHPANSRYFVQIILAFVPAVLYFVLQYLYYTGVVVPYTSGVEFGATLKTAWDALRSMLMMSAFPLFTLVFISRKDALEDKTVVLCLLMALFAALEAMFFRETGLRLDHGNFKWAGMSVAFLLWAVMLPKFIDATREYRARCALTDEMARTGQIGARPLRKLQTSLRWQSAAFFGAFVLLVWHAFSSIYYLYYLLSTQNVF